jgi:hypothetical protein
MTNEEKRMREWLHKQSVGYLRELCGWLHCLPDCAKSMTIPEIKNAVRSLLKINV